ncbi:MAG: molybdenum cofactor biosynthesis protein [Ignavibacteria bacterium]|nr:MAG: molybdenum cofactor biosynthesis protein [Ignavibacteria bacterium]KAF0160681.1 MAG: molybdenum cofactor biosynthesis protein [Ignavibacteria bacterium]
MPEEGIKLIEHSSILSFEEIVEFTKVAVEMGISKVRITGGEPLVRKGIINLVAMLSRITGIKDLSMTTNGLLLEKFAQELKTAGLQRVNISLDSIDEQKFSDITRGGNIGEVKKGIEAAKQAGLNPIKINCVIKKSMDEPDALEVKKYCDENGLEARFIYEMDIEKGEFGVVHGGSGGDCANCNRLRLTSAGFLKPCLFSDVSINIRKVYYKEAMRMAIEQKPACGNLSTTHKFYNIGG